MFLCSLVEPRIHDLLRRHESLGFLTPDEEAAIKTGAGFYSCHSATLGKPILTRHAIHGAVSYR
jgi:hypothetical protein